MRMMFTIGLFFTAMSVWGQNIINVNNTAAGVATDFTTLQEAVDSAQVGDIIYLYPSSTSYGDATITKQISIIGPGYDVAQNPSLEISTYTGNGIVGDVTFSDGSQGSLISGCDANYIATSFSANILIKRNKIRLRAYSGNCASIIWDGNYFLSTEVYACYSPCVHWFHLYITGSSNVIIKNNIFKAYGSYTGNCGVYSQYRTYDNISVDNNSNAIVRHNYFSDRSHFNNCLIENNIFTMTSQVSCSSVTDKPISSSNSTIINNVLVANQTGFPGSNLVGQNSDSIFKGWPTQGSESFDDRFQLKENSPAIGAGVGGVDCGPFGGDDPYVLSGLPFIPVVYEIIAPSTGTATGGLDVQIKVRSNN